MAEYTEFSIECSLDELFDGNLQQTFSNALNSKTPLRNDTVFLKYQSTTLGDYSFLYLGVEEAVKKPLPDGVPADVSSVFSGVNVYRLNESYTSDAKNCWLLLNRSGSDQYNMELCHYDGSIYVTDLRLNCKEIVGPAALAKELRADEREPWEAITGSGLKNLFARPGLFTSNVPDAFFTPKFYLIRRKVLTDILPSSTMSSGDLHGHETRGLPSNPPAYEGKKRDSTTVTKYFSPEKASLYASIGKISKSYFTLYQSDKVVAHMGLPTMPEEVSETNTPNFQSYSVFGRSVSYKSYDTTSRTLRISLHLHDELVNDRVKEDTGYRYLQILVSTIQSAAYPGYTESGFIDPPSVTLTLGNQFSIHGVIGSVSVDWKGPIIDNRYVECEIGFDITETDGPFSGGEVALLKGRRALQPNLKA